MLFFSLFFVFVCFYYHRCYANCLLTPCFQERCHEEAKEAFFHCRCQWIIQWWVISPHQISHGDKATSLSVQSIPAVYTSARGWNTITAITVQVFFFFPRLETLCTCAFLLKTRRFLIYSFILTSVVPFYLYLVHVYIVSRIAQKRNNIKCIIFVVLEWLPFICLPVTWRCCR